MTVSSLIAVAVIAGIVALIVLGGRRLLTAARSVGESARAKVLAAPAARLGLTAVADDQLTDLPPFELLNIGTDRHASNILRGSVAGRSVVVFDYAFIDRTKTAERFRGLHYREGLAGATVCCVKGSWLSLPGFTMEPLLKPMMKQAEALIDQQLGTGRMASAVQTMMHAAEGMIQEAPGFEFTDRPDVAYRVRGADETAIRARFTARVLDYFRDHPGWIVEGRGDWLLLTIATDVKGPVVTIQTGAGASATRIRQLPPDRLDTLVKAATDTIDVFASAASDSGVKI
jgi:hypothetical protein